MATKLQGDITPEQINPLAFHMQTSEVQRMVMEKLSKTNIVFIKGDDELLKNGERGYFKNYFLQVHPRTMTILKKYFLSSIADFIRNYEEDIKMNSEDYTIIAFTFLGFAEAVMDFEMHYKKDFLGRINKEYELNKALKSIFSEIEINEIFEEFKKTGTEFIKEIVETYQWIKEDAGPRKNQLDVLQNFVSALANKDKLSEEELKTAAKQVVENVPIAGAHSIFHLQQRERIGLLPPPKRLLANFEKIILFLDVYHYTGARMVK